jgi:hypothetical protein
MSRPDRIPLRPASLWTADLERQSWTRAIAAHVLARTSNKNPNVIVKAAWPSDNRAELIARSATTPTSRSDFPSRDIVESFRSLAPGSAALRLFELGLTLDLTGATTIRIPHVVNLPLQPIFIAEGAPAPAVQWTFASTIVGPGRKIVLLSAVTSEVNDATPETAAAVIGRVLADCTNRSIDTAAFGTQLDDTITPTGLLNGATPIAAAAAGVDAMAEDLGNLIGAIGNAGIDSTDAVFVCGPREATLINIKVGSTKFTNPVLSTLGLPPKTVACFAPAGVVSGWRDPPSIETAKESVIHFESATPADIVSTGGAVAAPVKSMFQTDVISIRVRANCAWAAVAGAAQVVENINW